MPPSRASRPDTTVTFLPHRLNRQPVVVRGLTVDELWITVGLSAACGLLLGIPLAMLMRSVAMAPTCVVLAIAAGVAGGGTVLRRHKRGRPETWLYRQLLWWVARHAPLLSGHVGAGELITRSGLWTTRRERRNRDTSR
jgi:conjugative transfer region protein (TIGR03750 family)